MPNESNNLLKKSAWPKSLRWSINALVLMLAFVLGQWWQQRDNLPVDVTVDRAFTLKMLDGQDFELSFAGNTGNTLVYFFAPWCHVCHLSMGNVQWLEQIRRDEDRIILVALGWSSVDEVSQFVSEHELTVPVVLGDQDVQSYFHIKGFPTYYVMNGQGKVVARDMGYSSFFGLWRRL